MKWTDVREITKSLADIHPDVNPEKLIFTDLMEMVLELPEFDDDPDSFGERILESIQQAWIEEIKNVFLL